MLYIFSDSDHNFFLTKTIDVARLPLKELPAHSQQSEDITYVDVSTLSKTARNKAVTQLKKRCTFGCCGILDPEQTVVDPASLLFGGIHDYIGGALCKETITVKRIKAVQAFAASCFQERCETEEKTTGSMSSHAFSGWNGLITGQTYEFCFLFVGIDFSSDMKSRLGEAGYKEWLSRFHYVLQYYLADAAPRLWIETEAGMLYLLPPLKKTVEAGIEGALRMLVSSPLIAYEKLRLPFFTDFIFALHIGSTEYAPKGSTGSIVSEAINFIYHLGQRKSDKGRITVSEEVYTLLENEKLKEFFVPHGSFEDHTLFHSKRFSFGKKRKK